MAKISSCDGEVAKIVLRYNARIFVVVIGQDDTYMGCKRCDIGHALTWCKRRNRMPAVHSPLSVCILLS